MEALQSRRQKPENQNKGMRAGQNSLLPPKNPTNTTNYQTRAQVS
jgi:hypothetical protein